ncbi:DUF6402 family protein [Edaphovirga cremea]|uniref:DUF6402 family protein n=1 Tax=Edaphovirga cremea TaxID=2267246 RepID=UPI000DEF99CB|nr:DUF6402 family protein [Edaphovirga cremea]
MADVKIKSMLTDKSESQQKVPIKIFKITDIPGVMEKKGWIESARFMRKWFYDPFYEMSKKEKSNKVDMHEIDKQHILDDLSFEWLYTASNRVGPVIDEVVRNISHVREYNCYLGRVEGLTKQLSNGLIALISRLEQLGLIDLKNKVIKSNVLDFSKLSAIELDKTSQFNYFPIGSMLWEKAADELDDVYGALGSFIIKIAFLNMIITKDKIGFFKMEISEIGLYVRDTYEFMNDGDDQPLGYWGWDNVFKPGIISELFEKNKISQDGKDYYRVTSGSFIQYREKCKGEGRNTTGDFFVYSTVKKIPVDIVIHLSGVDLDEYAARSNRNV